MPLSLLFVTFRSTERNYFLTIIPRARMGSESKAHEANHKYNCFSKIQLVGEKYRDKAILASKSYTKSHRFNFKAGAFRY